MANDEQSGPRLAARGHLALAARQAREAQALRENLRKRAAQRRDRAAPEPMAPAGAGGDPDPGSAPEGKA